MQTSQKTRTSIYLDQKTKIEAKKLFKKYNISLSDAVNMFLSQSVLEQGMPFEMQIPKDVEIINPKDPDYMLIDKTKNDDKISLNEFLKR